MPDSLFNRPMYVELTRFHAAMYFSMHAVTHDVSELDRDEPGVGTHFSKQLDLRFCDHWVPGLVKPRFSPPILVSRWEIPSGAAK